LQCPEICDWDEESPGQVEGRRRGRRGGEQCQGLTRLHLNESFLNRRVMRPTCSQCLLAGPIHCYPALCPAFPLHTALGCPALEYTAERQLISLSRWLHPTTCSTPLSFATQLCRRGTIYLAVRKATMWEGKDQFWNNVFHNADASWKSNTPPSIMHSICSAQINS
jgi:hypothetical protein